MANTRTCATCQAPMSDAEMFCRSCGAMNRPGLVPAPPPLAPAGPPMGPPLGILSGVVADFGPEGFDVRGADGRVTRVTTLTDGRFLGLALGEPVSVTGGPDPQGRWASSAILAGRPGHERTVRDG